MQVSPTSYAVTGLGAPAPWAVNAGFVVGKKKTLILDTSSNYFGAQTIYGYARAVCPNNELLAVNLEPHMDHIGGNSFLSETGVPIYGHSEVRRTEEEFLASKEYYNQGILSEVRRHNRETEAFFCNTELRNADHTVARGDIFDLGGIEVEILATPGHTSLNLSAYNRNDRTLFCADCIVSSYIPNLEEGSKEDWQSWLDSLDAIEQLNPDIVVPGHGDVISQLSLSAEIDRIRGFVQAAIESGIAPTQ